MTVKRYGLITMLLLSSLLFPLQSSFGDSVTILTPSQIPVPQLVARAHPTTIVIEADPITLPHSGDQIAIASPTGGLNSAGGCPITYSGGPNWELRADTDGDMDFTDAGSAAVGYDLFAAGDSISFEFGDGGFVTITTSGGATVTPAAPLGGYAWQEDGLTGVGTFGTDNTLALGVYSVGSCGTENVDLVSIFFGTAQFIVVEGCVQSSTQPEDPVSMNTVRRGDIVKTIHAEKQIFDCTLEQGLLPVTADVTIIAEIYEDMDTKSVIKKQALAITCIKDFDSGEVLECSSYIPSQETSVVTNCVEEPIGYPQEMNTVRKGNIVKTIEAQKEVFECILSVNPIVIKKVDVVLFTEIWENVNLLSDPIIKIAFESMRCTINLSESSPLVESCQFPKIFN